MSSHHPVKLRPVGQILLMCLLGGVAIFIATASLVYAPPPSSWLSPVVAVLFLASAVGAFSKALEQATTELTDTGIRQRSFFGWNFIAYDQVSAVVERMDAAVIVFDRDGEWLQIGLWSSSARKELTRTLESRSDGLKGPHCVDWRSGGAGKLDIMSHPRHRRFRPIASILVRCLLGGAIAFKGAQLFHENPRRGWIAAALFFAGAVKLFSTALEQATTELTDAGIRQRSLFGRKFISYDQVVSVNTFDMPMTVHGRGSERIEIDLWWSSARRELVRTLKSRCNGLTWPP